MPSRPLPRCTQPGCPNRQPCSEHDREADRDVKQRQDWRWVYRDKRWHRLKTIVLREEPLCRTGCGRRSELADHIRPFRHDVERLAFDRANVQGLCKPCHDSKTARENQLGGHRA